MALPFLLSVDDVIRHVRSGLLDYTDTVDISYYDIAEIINSAYRRVCLRVFPYVPHAFERTVDVVNGAQLPDDYVIDVRCIVEREGQYFPARRVTPPEWHTVIGAAVQPYFSHGNYYQPAYVIWGGYDTIAANLIDPPNLATTGIDITTIPIVLPRIYISPGDLSGVLTYYGIPSQIPTDAGGARDTTQLLPLAAEFHSLVITESMLDIAFYIGLDHKNLYSLNMLLEQKYDVLYQTFSDWGLYQHPIYGEEIGKSVQVTPTQQGENANTI